MRILVTGTRGFVGNRLSIALSRFAEVIRISRNPGCGELPLNLLHPQEFPFSVLCPNDVVIFTAAVSSPDACTKDPDESHKINVSGTIFFVEQAIARGSRVLFFSSDTAVGGSMGEAWDDASIQPAGVYGTMKGEVERHFAGEPLVKVLRPSYIVSLRDKFATYLQQCARKGTVAEVFHPFYRNAIHIYDVCAAVRAVCEGWCEIPEQQINACGPNLLSRVDLAETIKGVLGLDLVINVVEPPPDFFLARPREILLSSRILPRILGRPPKAIRDALCEELKDEGEDLP